MDRVPNQPMDQDKADALAGVAIASKESLDESLCATGSNGCFGRTMPPDQTRSTLTTLHRPYSLGTHKTKPGGQAESERNSATVCDFTGTQRSISTGISAGQGPRYVRSSSIFVGRYRMSFSKARYYRKLRGSRGSDPRHLRLTMNRLLDCTSQERPSTSSFVCVPGLGPSM